MVNMMIMYFPFVVVGVGQAVIMGTNQTGGTVHGTAEVRS